MYVKALVVMAFIFALYYSAKGYCSILKRLETAKMLTVRSEEYGGRLRKYYRITKNGIARMEEFKREWEQIVSIYSFVVKEGEGND